MVTAQAAVRLLLSIAKLHSRGDKLWATVEYYAVSDLVFICIPSVFHLHSLSSGIALRLGECIDN
jgi:hypothetical protein